MSEVAGDGGVGDEHAGVAATVDPAQVAERVAELRAVVERHAVRPVSIVAVTKRFGPDAVAAAVAAGIHDMGENYAQELAAKAAATGGIEPPVRWHFIGHVQRNKVRTVADVVSCWHTVDTVRLGAEIARRAPGARVLVQVNATGAPNQSGVEAADVGRLIDELRSLDLDVAGLMTIGAAGDVDESRLVFERVRALADSLELTECSMGMSGDLVEALRSGSTMVRVGTALFGVRPQASRPPYA